MRLLLDTHVVIWWYDAPERIRPSVLAQMTDGAHTVFVSAVTTWELAIKAGLGKIRLPKPLGEMCAEDWFLELPVTFEHSLQIESLPSIHHDPFDRMLVAQAMVDELTIVTRDTRIARYPIATLEA